ncbi:vitamin B12 dependent-methionine synthase activation domain-containing protein [Candidatus Formimonas warabiya]|uniref:Vitamin B12 dependent methionine synthase n=1 Tax=Formimonas warabiya TaxID=1761012 RepID=A0A3G1KN69_FORW1|nr:vitamin B12 dependent-methionine synthase activation domain-containing protein [Candidatus Formimonas warabiya]ATW23913.1 vitamin B12 dependent methionine synthase [Candidatus Formimonas warabiya]
MDTAVLNLSFEIDLDQLLHHLHIKPGSPHVEKVKRLVDEAASVAKPKAVYQVAYVDEKNDNDVVINGIKFTSRVLRVNLEEAYRVFPYVVTCGAELEEWSKKIDDMFDSFCVDAIKEAVLRSARQNFTALIDQEYGLGHAANMNPGSLQDWPLREQKPLFQLLGNVKDLIGVELTDSFLMIPIKTVSGIRFPKEGTYENCQLCPREKCPGRKAPYDKDLYEEKFKLK